MTYNIRFANPRDGLNAWPLRRDFLRDVVRRQDADLIGFQEVLAGQLRDLERMLPEYDHYGVGRNDGRQAGEFSPIFYRRDRFEVRRRETLWLSETPDRVSIGWDAALPRIATLLELRDKRTGGTLWVANTHFDHRGAEARAGSARLLHETLAERAGDTPAILMGDLNCLPQSDPHNTLTGRDQPDADEAAWALQDTRDLAEEPLGPNSTWNGFHEIVPGRRIDFVLIRGPWRVSRFEIPADRRQGRFASDHLPVVAVLEPLRLDSAEQPAGEAP